MRFLPRDELIAVLPPIELSTCAKSVGGDLDKARATAQNGSRETGQIADHAAAQSDDAIIALNRGRFSKGAI
jgi:hypothetical protein